VRKADLSTEQGAREACEGEWDGMVLSVAARGGDFRHSYKDSMQNVLRALKRPPGCFVYTSSTSVYAQTDGGWVMEDSPTEPTYDNGRILLETEHLLADGCIGKFPGIVLRLSGIYGPGRLHGLEQMRKGVISLPGKGSHWKNQIHRDDAVGALVHVLNHFAGSSPAFHCFNVSDDEPVSRADYVAWLCHHLKRSPPSFQPGESAGRRTDFQSHRRISNRKLRDLGWELQYPTFRKGLMEEVNQ